MIRSSCFRVALAIAACLAGMAPVRAQCSDWKVGFDYPGTGGDVYDFAEFDDGSGPAVYVCGIFTNAGGGTANRIAKWNGTNWSAVGGGDSMTNGLNGIVYAMEVFDDGSGPALYAAGDFTTAGGTGANNIAKWDGSAWSALGTGMNQGVSALTMFDDGSGPALYAGGSFTTAGGVSANRMAKWNGTSWSALGTGMNQGVSALTVFDDGTGAVLCAGGYFTTADGASANRVASWDGTSWSPLGSGVNQAVYALAVFDDGSGIALYAGCDFGQIWKWDGTSWLVGPGVQHSITQAYVLALGVFDDGSGSALFIGGFFDSPASCVVKWYGASGAALGQGMTNSVFALTVFDDGSGSELYATGGFVLAGSAFAQNIAKWNGTRWDSLDAGLSSGNFPATGYCLATFDNGSGRALYVGGTFRWAGGPLVSRIAKWNGTTWSSLGMGVSGDVYALGVFDDGSGSALYAGGMFSTASGVSVSRIAKWNGSTWSALGSGVVDTTPSQTSVDALAVFDDGSGPALFAGGRFVTASGVGANRIAKWNGSTWSALGTGMDGLHVYALTVFDDGAGPALYAGGDFTTSGGVTTNRIAKWDGTNWSAVGGGMDGEVRALFVFDDGSGPALHASGSFGLAGGVSAKRIAKWNGVTWSALGSGLNAMVRAMAAFDDGADGAPDLYVGGDFTQTGDNATNSYCIAEWFGCEPGEAYCFGDGIDTVVTAQCPCANVGAPGRGCANSIFANGARLLATGKKSPNTMVFVMSDVPNDTLATGLRNTTNTNPGGVVFGDGVRCQSGTLIRFGSHNTGSLGDAPNTWTSTTSTVSPGNTRYYQVQYRNPAPAFCPPETFNISNAYRIDW